MYGIILFILFIIIHHPSHAANICDLLSKEEKGELLIKEDFLDSEQNIINIKELRNKILILFFWTKWSPECIRDLKNLNEIQKLFIEKEEDNNIMILPVAITDKTDNMADDIRSLYNIHKINNLSFYFDIKGKYHTILSESDLNLPLLVIVDQNGREIGRTTTSILHNIPHSSQLIKDIKECSK